MLWWTYTLITCHYKFHHACSKLLWVALLTSTSTIVLQGIATVKTQSQFFSFFLLKTCHIILIFFSAYFSQNSAIKIYLGLLVSQAGYSRSWICPESFSNGVPSTYARLCLPSCFLPLQLPITARSSKWGNLSEKYKVLWRAHWWATAHRREEVTGLKTKWPVQAGKDCNKYVLRVSQEFITVINSNTWNWYLLCQQWIRTGGLSKSM